MYMCDANELSMIYTIYVIVVKTCKSLPFIVVYPMGSRPLFLPQCLCIGLCET